MNGWTLLVNDALVTEQPCVLVRVIPLVSSDGGDVTLYDGQSKDARKIQKLTALANQPLAVEFDILCDDGLYVDIGSNVTSVLVVWRAVAEPAG